MFLLKFWLHSWNIVMDCIYKCKCAKTFDCSHILYKVIAMHMVSKCNDSTIWWLGLCFWHVFTTCMFKKKLPGWNFPRLNRFNDALCNVALGHTSKYSIQTRWIPLWTTSNPENGTERTQSSLWNGVQGI